MDIQRITPYLPLGLLIAAVSTAFCRVQPTLTSKTALASQAAPQANPQVNPKVVDAQKLIANKQYAEAEDILKQLVDANPKMPGAWMLLGLARHSQQKWDLALEAHLKAAEFPQMRSRGLYNAACVYSIKQNADKAIETLKSAIAAGFGDRTLLKSDNDLAFVRKDPRFAALIPPILNGKDLFVEPTRVIHTFEGEAPNGEFGWVARKVGDLDGDKVTDFATSAPGFRNHWGKVYAFSSRTGKLIFEYSSPTGGRFGNGVAGAGDVNKDGTPDVLVCGPVAPNGIAVVLSGKNGALLLSVEGTSANVGYGSKATGIGDINLDGHADFALSAPQAVSKEGAAGSVFGYSGKDGSQLFRLDGMAAGDNFGSIIAGTSDSRGSLMAVGAADAAESKGGKVYLYRFEKATPVLVTGFQPDAKGDNFANMFLCFPGDFDRDGVLDVFSTDFSDSTAGPGTGRCYVMSGKTGRTLLDIKGTQPGENLGTSVSDAGDVDGDGIPDLVIGAWQNRSAAISGGKTYLYSGATGKVLRTWTCKQAGDTFGFDATGLGDVDGDGKVDFLITSAYSDTKGPKTGRVFIIAGN